MQVPEKVVGASIKTKAGASHRGVYEMAPARTIRFGSTACEVHIKIADDVVVRPDVVGYRNEKQLLVEMYFRHAVDEEKRAKLTRLGAPAIEIDLSDLDLDAGFDAIRQRVLEDTIYKEWLVYPGEADAKAALIERLLLEGDELDKRKLELDKRQLLEKAAALKKQQQKEQAQLAKRERLERERLAERERILAAHKQYRDSSADYKEQQLRTVLGISDLWPRHLRVSNPLSGAINASVHLWQASLFHRYIYNKPLQGTFETGDAFSWVQSRFDVPADNTSKARAAVQKYLAYLVGCGVIKKWFNPYGEDHFIVLHNKLEPPPRDTRITQRKPAGAENQYGTGTLALKPVTGQAPVWVEDRPDYDTAMKAATKWICMHRQQYIDMINRLYTTDVQIDLQTFADKVVTNGIPAKETVRFLIEAGLVT